VKGFPLPKALRIEATMLALEMIWSQPDIVVVKALVKHYTVSEPTARKIIRDARALVKEEFRHTAETAIEKGVLELQAVFRAAFKAGKYAAAVQAKRLQLEVLTGAKLDRPSEFGHGKSERELLFYASNGFWPEEDVLDVQGETAPALELKGEDPLAALPPLKESDGANS